jgi:hypothetical protein
MILWGVTGKGWEMGKGQKLLSPPLSLEINFFIGKGRSPVLLLPGSQRRP